MYGRSSELGLYLRGNQPLPIIAGAPTARGRWVSPRPVGESAIPIATGGGPPTGRGQYKVPPTGGWTSACGDQNVGLTHQAGATHCSRAVGAPARWAGGDFPTGINLAHCSACT